MRIKSSSRHHFAHLLQESHLGKGPDLATLLEMRPELLLNPTGLDVVDKANNIGSFKGVLTTDTRGVSVDNITTLGRLAFNKFAPTDIQVRDNSEQHFQIHSVALTCTECCCTSAAGDQNWPFVRVHDRTRETPHWHNIGRTNLQPTNKQFNEQRRSCCLPCYHIFKMKLYHVVCGHPTSGAGSPAGDSQGTLYCVIYCFMVSPTQTLAGV